MAKQSSLRGNSEVGALSRPDFEAVRLWCRQNDFDMERVNARKFADWPSYRAAFEGVEAPDDAPILQPDSGGVIVLLGARPGSGALKGLHP